MSQLHIDTIARVIDPEAFDDPLLMDDLTPSERLNFSIEHERRKTAASNKARAIAPIIEAARAEGQKDMQERCRHVVKTCSVQYAPQNCSGRIERQIDNCRDDIEVSIAALPIDGANQIQSSDGRVPERETHWLAERTGTGLYIRHGLGGDLTDDVWHAHRFQNERDAFDYIRLSRSPFAKELRATEHVFINKIDGPSEAKQGAEPVAYLCNGEGDGWKESNRVVFGKANADRYRNEYKGWTVQPLYTAPPAPDREAVAKEIWHRFAPIDHIEWQHEAHKAEYLLCADALLSLLGGTR